MVASITLMAQVTTSSMSGKIVDNGGPLPGATVIATHVPSGTFYGTTTNSEGRYSLQGMRVGGPYTVEVRFVGYTPSKAENITLKLGETYRRDFMLQSEAIGLGEVVISGEKTTVSEACVRMKQAGAKRALPLAVGGAFHSPLMEPARLALGKAIEATPFVEPVCPVYQNVTATAETDPDRIKANLLAQLTSPVRWTQSVKAMIADGASSFTEMGPGTVLQGLVKRIAGAVGAEVTIEGKQ